jgi:hypothetical protein
MAPSWAEHENSGMKASFIALSSNKFAECYDLLSGARKGLGLSLTPGSRRVTGRQSRISLAPQKEVTSRKKGVITVGLC